MDKVCPLQRAGGYQQELTALRMLTMQGSSQAGSSQVWQERLLFS